MKSTGDEAAALQASQQTSRRGGADEASAFFSRPVKIRTNRTKQTPSDGPSKEPENLISRNSSCIFKLGLIKHLPTFCVTVKPSKFRGAAKTRREEVQGAEEVQEDENTATELPVDQVSFLFMFLTVLYKMIWNRLIRVWLSLGLIFCSV